MKIILTRPNYDSHLITPPLGLGYIASFLKSKGYQSSIVDGLNLGWSNFKIAEHCQGVDFVGINCLSSYFEETIDLSRRLKEKGATVIIGGPQASALPEITLNETYADYVVIGEGELTMFELIESIKSHKDVVDLTGVYTNKTTVINKRKLFDNLDDLPFPDWIQIDPRKYKKAPHGGVIKSFPVAPVISSRGCPFNCKFCASPFLWDRKIRYRSPENVVEEIEYLVKEFGVKEIHFEDDNITLAPGHIEKISSLIIKKNLKINWGCPNGVRTENLTRELLLLMKKSGCYFLAFGIESGNQEILNAMNKHSNLAAVSQVIRLANSIGIVTQGFFIFGLPGETQETVHQTIRFAKELPLDKAQFLYLDILPGSELWKELGSQVDIFQNKRSYQEVRWIPPTIDKDVLNNALSHAFRTFFFRPRQLFLVLKFLKLSQLKFIIKRLIDFKIIPVKK